MPAKGLSVGDKAPDFILLNAFGKRKTEKLRR